MLHDDEAATWRQLNGEVSAGMKTAILGAAVFTVVMAAVLVQAVHRQFAVVPDSAYHELGDHVALGLVAWTGVVAIALVLIGGVSSWVRAAVAVALVQAGMLTAIGVAWHLFDDPYLVVPLVDDVPVHWVALALGGALVALALVGSGRRGVPGWLPAAAVFAVVHLLVLGAWLPTVVGAGDFASLSDAEAARSARALLPLVVGVPLVVAAVVAAWVAAVRRRGVPPSRLLGAMAWALLVAYIVAITLAPRDYAGQLVLSNLAHVLAGAVALAWCTLLALAVGHLRALRAVRHDRRRSAPWVQEGVAVVDGATPTSRVIAPIARLHFVGWMGGFATTSLGFRLRTRTGELPVPAGAGVVARLGPWSVPAAPGDALAVVRDGDRVVVSGFVAPPAAGPFRESSLPIAGSAGLVLGRADEPRAPIGAELVLALWRPCLLFLLASVLACLPVVVGA